jgi:hypothetical protein
MSEGNGIENGSVLLHIVSEATYDRHGIVLEILNEGTRPFKSRELVEYHLSDHYPADSYRFLTLADSARDGQDRHRNVYVEITGPARVLPKKWLPGER